MLVLLSAELLADDRALANLQRMRDARRPILPVVLRACDWEIAPPLRGLSPISQQPLTTWEQPEAFWVLLLQHVQRWAGWPARPR